MNKRISLSLMLVLSLLLTFMPVINFAPRAEAQEITVVVIGKSVHPYWANVEKGVMDAAEALGVKAEFFVPTTEDVPAQLSTMESYIALGVNGIAIAPSDPVATADTIKKAMDAGIPVITLDTDAPESVRLAYIGTDNKAAGVVAGQEMAKLLPEGKVAIGTGSLTALNSLGRMEGFREAVAGTAIEIVEPVNNDKEDSATALEQATASLIAHPDLAGAFGVYAYNGPAWAKAVKEQGRVGEVKIVCFDATTEHINFVKEGVIDVLVAQREYFQGYKSVELLTLMAQKGIEEGMAEYGVPESKIVDTGVDVVTKSTLAAYAYTLDELGIPREWELPSYTIAMVVKNLGNPFFEASKKGGEEVGQRLNSEFIFQGPATPTAEGQIEIIDALIAQKVDVIAITANDPDALVPVCKKAMDAGIKVVTWDSAVAPEGRQIFVNQADMEAIGRIEVQMLAEMIDYEGQIAILSAASTMANQNTWIEWMKEELKDPKYEKMELVGIVYGDDLREKSYTEAQGLFKSYPDLKGIISPTTVGIAATARAIKDAGLSGKVALTGLGLPSEMAEYILDGTCEEMALWNPIELGYLSTWVSYLMADGAITGQVGETFMGGKLGEFTVVAEDGGTMVILGPPFKFNAENINEWKDVY